jgi:IclR family pca regulon transcriptional regulator
VLLAHQPENVLEQLLAEMRPEKFTDKTETSIPALRDILADVRRRGYASIQDELDYGIVSVAVPVRLDDGQVIAAINCSTATTRVNETEMVETRLPHLRSAAGKIETELRRYPVLVHSIRGAAD